jgi:hypothetical protein
MKPFSKYAYQFTDKNKCYQILIFMLLKSCKEFISN